MTPLFVYNEHAGSLIIRSCYDDPNPIIVGCTPNIGTVIRDNLYTLSLMYEHVPYEPYDLTWNDKSYARNIDTLERLQAFTIIDEELLSIYAMRKPDGFNLYVFDSRQALPYIVNVKKVRAKAFISDVVQYYEDTLPIAEVIGLDYEGRYASLRRNLIMRLLSKDDRKYCYEIGKDLNIFPIDKSDLVVYAGACKLGRLKPLHVDESLFVKEHLKTPYKTVVVVQSEDKYFSTDLQNKLDEIVKKFNNHKYDIALFMCPALYEKSYNYLCDAGIHLDNIFTYVSLLMIQGESFKGTLACDIESVRKTGEKIVNIMPTTYKDSVYLTL